jgi:hypothetical protein
MKKNIKYSAVVVVIGIVFSSALNQSAAFGNENVQSIKILGDKEKRNSYFGVSPTNFPELGQTFEVKKSISISRVQISPTMISRAISIDFFSGEEYALDKVENKFSGKPIKARTTLTIYKWGGAGKPPEYFDLSQGFSQIHSQNFKKPLAVGKPFVLNLNKKVKLEKGIYFIVYGFNFPDKRIIEVRFAGQENGTNTMGGLNYDKPFDCKYKMTKDRSPGFMSYITDSKDRPKTGEFPGTVGFGTSFRRAVTKITECAVLGVYGNENMIWNPGDLDLILHSR